MQAVSHSPQVPSRRVSVFGIEADDAASQAEHGDYLAARTLEEAGEGGERRVEGRVRAGHRDLAAENGRDSDYRRALEQGLPLPVCDEFHLSSFF